MLLACGLFVVIFGLPSALLLTCRFRDCAQRADRFLSPRAGTKILVLGDSHARAFVEGACGIRKIAATANPLNMSLMRLKEFEKRGGLKGVDTCVVTFCHTAFCEMTCEAQMLAMWHFLPLSLDHIDLMPMNRFDLWSGLLDVTIRNIGETPSVAWDYSKVDPADDRPSLAERPAEWVRRAARETLARHFSWEKRPESLVQDMDGFLVRIMMEMKSICDAHGVRLVFVSTPLPEVYRNGIPDWAKLQFSDWQDRIRSLGIKYFDCMDIGAPEWFMDADHLNDKGAKRFTEMFCSRYLK